jgi:hypothetical protein
MKPLLFVVLFLFFVHVSKAQVDTIEYKYCKVMTVPVKISGYKVYAYIDSGQPCLFNEKQYKDEKEISVEFNSDIDVLNFIAKKGWIYCSVFYTPEQARTQFIMKKPIKY